MSIIRSQCLYEKYPGWITVSLDTLFWTQGSDISTHSTPSLTLPINSIKALYINNVSTNGKCLLKVTPDSISIDTKTADYLFQFTEPNAISNRELVKNTLSERMLKLKHPTSIDIPKGQLTQKDIRTKSTLLSENKELALIHKHLVLGGLISEEEFWKERSKLLELQGLKQNQQQGISSMIVSDIRPSETGEQIKYTLTPTMIHSIFMQFPTIKQAFNDLVETAEIEEKEFWALYFQSKHFNKDIQSTTLPNILDSYLERIPSFISKYKPMNHQISPLFDITSTLEDHPTLTLHSDSKSSKLVQKYNQHSEMILETISQSTIKNLDDIFILEDLNNITTERGIPIDVSIKDSYQPPIHHIDQSITSIATLPSDIHMQEWIPSPDNLSSCFIDPNKLKMLSVSSLQSQSESSTGPSDDTLALILSIIEIQRQFYRDIQGKQEQVAPILGILEKLLSQLHHVKQSQKSIESIKNSLLKAIELGRRLSSNKIQT